MIWIGLVFDGFTGLLELPVWPNCGSGRHSLAASSGSEIQLGSRSFIVSVHDLVAPLCLCCLTIPYKFFADRDDLDAKKSVAWMRSQRYM